MSYVALYRKFRPAVFEEVKGQDAIVRALGNQVRSGRVGHAYLFCGTRGTGKTSVAKILAKAVNCAHPVNGSPCGNCPSCRSIADGSSMNVMEIDAASNNGVDNVRDLKEQVAYAPTEGRYKVFIIDEVHMLSASAFNALLKTLEEPPSYVIFILATTEAHRIPVTILSRCQRYDFRRIGTSVIADRLAELTQAEGVDAQPQALEYLARMADGSMRDALSLLDQCISFYPQETLTYEGVLSVLGAVDDSVFDDLLRCILKENVSGALALTDRAAEEGRDLSQFVSDFCGYLRNLLIVKAARDTDELLTVTEEKKAQLQDTAALLSEETLIRYIRILSQLEGELRYASSKRLQIEVAVIKLCRPQTQQDYESLLARIDSLERTVESLQREGVKLSVQPQKKQDTNTAPAAAKTPEKPKILPQALPEDIRSIAGQWGRIIRELPASVREAAKKGRLSTDEDACRLLLVFEDATAAEHVKTHLDAVKDALRSVTGKETVIFVETVQDASAGGRIDLEAYLPGVEIVVEDD